MNGQRFIVRLFVGDIPDDPRTWATSESCVGNFAVLPPPQAPTGPAVDVKAYDEISLVQALMGVGHDGQDVSAVVRYLKENFEWRVQLVCLLLLDWLFGDLVLMWNRWTARLSQQTSIQVWKLWSRRRSSRLRGISTSFRAMGRRLYIRRSRRGRWADTLLERCKHMGEERSRYRYANVDVMN